MLGGGVVCPRFSCIYFFDDFARAVIKKLLQELDVAAAPGAHPSG